MTLMPSPRISFSCGVILAFVGSATSFQAVHLSTPRVLRPTPFRIYSEKPTRAQIEEAAGLREAQVSNPELATVHGVVTEPPSVCQCYVNCPLLNSPNSAAIRDRLASLTEPRAYSLFVAEKAAKYLIDDVWSPPKRHSSNPLFGTATATADKEKLVILGAGWGSAAILKGIDTERYDVTVISPRNYFLFTPMLAGAAVGTVDIRSITQPIREASVFVQTDAFYS